MALLERAAATADLRGGGDELALQAWDTAIDIGVSRDFYEAASYLYGDASLWEKVVAKLDDEGDAHVIASIKLFQLSDVEGARELAEARDISEVEKALENLDEASENWRKFQRSYEKAHSDLDGEAKALKVYLHMADLGAALGEQKKEIDALRRLDRQVDDQRVSNRLKMLYRRSEKWPMYVDILKTEADELGEDRVDEKVDRLKEMVRVYRQEMNHDRMAINIYKEILELAPKDLGAIDELIELYEDMNMSSDLIKMLRQKAELVGSEDKKVEILGDVARLFLDKFRNQAEAIKAYEEVLEIEPYHGEAITFLKEMYEKRRDWESLIAIHQREIETFESEEQKADGLKHVAQLATDRLRNPDVAAELWGDVREVVPEDREALDALEKLYEKKRDYEALAEILEQKIPVVEADDEKMKLYQKLGMLYSDRLEDTDQAIEAWQGALELNEEDLKARKALERLYIDDQRFDELEAFYAEADGYSDLVRVLGTLTGRVKEEEVKLGLLLRTARIWREELGDTSRAERELERVLEIDAENLEAAQQLEPIYREADDPQRLKEALEIILSHLQEGEERKRYQLKLGRLHRDELEDWSEAFNWLGDAFLEVQGAFDVVEELEEAAAVTESWADVVDYYRQALEAAEEADGQKKQRLLLGRVLSEEVERLGEALVEFEVVLEDEEDNLEALAAMESIHRRNEDWDDLMKVYRHRLELEESNEARVGILQGMAEIAEKEAGDVVTAIARFNEALELDGRNEKTLQQLHRLYRSEEEYADLAEVIRREIDLIERRARQSERRREVTTVDAQSLVGEAAEAADSSTFGDGFGGSDEGVDDVLADLHAPDEDPVQEGEEALDVEGQDETPEVEEGDVDEGQAESLDDVDMEAKPRYRDAELEALTSLRVELGTICLQVLGESQEAVELLREVVRIRPMHQEAIGLLESLLDDPLFEETVADILEPVYDVHGRWDDLVELLEIQAESREEVDEQIDRYHRQGEVLLEEVGDGEKAFSSYAEVLKRDRGDETARKQFYRIAHELEMWESWVEQYEELQSTIDDESLKISYLYELGQVSTDHREAHDEARRYFEEIYGLDPEAMRALDELEELFVKTEAWRDLLDVIDRKIELIDDEGEVEELEFRKAKIWQEFLDDSHEAIAIYEAILERDPENLRAYSHLDLIYEHEGMWHELAEDLKAELELVDESEKNEIKARLAQVLEAQLHDAEAAVDLYEEILEDVPAHEGANEAMTALMRGEGGPRLRVSQIMEPLFAERGDAQALIEALEVQVDETMEADEEVELLHRIAGIYEEVLAEYSSAFETYARALAVNVEDEETLEELYRLAEGEEGHQRLVEVLEERADEHPDPDIKRGMLRRASQLYIDPLAQLDEATDRLHAVLDLFPADLVTVEELEEIYRQTQQWEDLVDILVTKAELVEELDERKELFHQAGTLYEDILERPQDAIDIYNRALTIDGEDRHAIDRLEVLYTSLERWHDLLDVYQRKLDLAQDDTGRKDLLYVMGAIYRDHLEALPDAIDTYRQVLDINEEEGQALEQLDELFQQTEQWHELLEILERRKTLASTEEEAHGYRFRIGMLWKDYLNDGLQAIEVFNGVLSEDSNHMPSIQALETMVEEGQSEVEAAQVLKPLYREKEQWTSLVQMQRLLIEATHDPSEKIAWYLDTAQIIEDRLEDKADAFATYIEAFEVEPGRQEILETLERLARELEGWSVLIEELDLRLEEINDYDVLASIQLRIARIYEEELDQPQEAIARYRRVLELEPDQETAILALDRLYQREGQWEDLGEILKQRIYNSDDMETTLELRLRLGTLQQTALEDAGSAISSYQEVLLEEPGHPAAIEHLEQMFIEGYEVERIADILEPHYMEHGQFQKVIDSYLRRLEFFEDPFQRFDLLVQAGRLYLDELESPTSALQVFGRALQERPDDAQVIADIERLAEDTSEWGLVAELYADALESPEAGEEAQLGIWIRLARVLDDKMEAFEDAEMAYQQALALEPTHEESLQALDRIYLAQARWEDLTGVLQRRIEGTFDEFEVIELNYRLAQIYQDQLGDFASAVQTYEEMLRLQPDHEEALEHLERIHMAMEDWEPLFDVLERRSTLTHDPDEQADLFSRMAQLAEEMLGRREDSVDLWRRVTEVRPDDREALGELRRLYIDDQRWEDLVEVLRREVELAQTEEERLGFYESLGTIYSEYLQDEVQAQDAWRSVLEIDPVHLEALEALKELTTRQADYQQLAEILERLIAHEAVDQERTLGLWEELAEVQSEMLMNPAAAIEAWTQVVSLNPEHGSALNELERLYLQESRWEEAANILEIKADRVVAEEARIDLLERVADLWESKLFESAEAIVFYEQILEIDPEHMEASRALERIYREQGTEEAFGELAGLYLDRAEIVDDPFGRLDNLKDAARIFEQQLEQPENALVVLLSAVSQETVGEEELFAEIERLAKETEMWAEAIGRFDDVVEELGDTPEAVELFVRIGRWYAEELDLPDEGAYYLQWAKMVEPENLEVLELLQELYRQLAAWPELAQVLETRVGLSHDPDEQIELWRTLGELYEMQMQEIDEAVSAYEEILEIEPTDILAMESLERVYEAFEHWEELVDILGRKAESTYDPDLIVEIKSRAAETWEKRLGNVDQAIMAYNDVLSVDQAHEASLDALERLYSESERYDELIDVYEQKLSLTHEPEGQVELYGKMAVVFEEYFEDYDRAVEAYNNLLMIEPENVSAVQELERLYRHLERWFELVEMLQRHIELSDREDEQVDLLAELGQVQYDEVGDPHAAIEAFEQAVELDPVNPGLWSELAALHEATNNWERAVEAYDRLVEQLDDEETRADIYFRLGELLEGQLHDHASAEDAYLSALRLDPGRREVLSAVRELLAMQQQWEKLVRVLQDVEEHERDLDQKAVVLAEIGEIYEENMGDEVSALGYYEASLEQNPRYTPAALPIIEVAIRDRRYEKAIPLLEMALEEYRGTDVDDSERHRRHLQLAQANEELAQHDQALHQYRKAYEFDSTDRETLEGFGHLLYERQEWEQASKVLQNLQLHHEEELDRQSRAQVYHRLGAIRQELNDLRKAGEYFDRALELDQHHKETLERRVEVAEARHEHERVVEFTRWLLETEEDPQVRFAKLSRLGDLLSQELSRPQEAVGAYVEALDIEPNSVVVLRKLLDLYTKTRQWHEAVGILMRIIEQEDQAARIAKYYYTAAVIYRDKIEDPMQAVELFDKALDADTSSMLKAFEAIDRILTKLKSWRELARAYRRMLHRIKQQDDDRMEHIKVQLWQNLGEVYRTRMGDFETAIEAYKIAVGLDESNEDLRVILADLYERTGENPQGVIEQHRELIKINRFRVESYRKLFTNYIETKKYDRAWCMAGALSFLESATEREEKFYRKYLGAGVPKASANFNQETFKKLYHTDQDVVITYIMSILGQGLRPNYSISSIKDWGVHKRKDKVAKDDESVARNVYNYVTQTINLLPPPRLYLKGDQAMGMRNANCDPPTVLMGGDVRQKTNEREVTFVTAKALTWMLPQHYMGSIGQPTEFLKLYVMALIDITDPSRGLSQHFGEQEMAAKQQIMEMPGPLQVQAQKAMKRFMETGKNPNLSQWLKSVEHTAIRAGLLLCGDIHTAAACIKSDMVPIGKASMKEKIREMVLFSISEEYFELREELGLAIQ